MAYEVKTPLIQESVEAARAAIIGIQTGALEPRQASILVSGARAFQSAVTTDLKARIMLPKITMLEAKAGAAAGA
jgi:hypothetical protein